MQNTIITKDQPLEPEEIQARLALMLNRFKAAQKKRSNWESLWEECYNYALPQRGGFTGQPMAGQRKTDQIYDATAMDAADQLASSMLGNLTPTWSQWFGLKAGPDLSDEESERLAPVLEKAAKTIQDHFDRSNFAVEIHQCYLDLIVGGTASLVFEESQPGSFSAFKFSSTPLTHVVLEEGDNGHLDGAFRLMKLTLEQIKSRYPASELPSEIMRRAARDPQERFKILEAVLPDGLIYSYHACLIEQDDQPVLLSAGSFEQSPMISFRWLKSPGEIYGRSPIMKALPDIKTANKVVELILKNASIAVTGIWQADDDGVLNPANIELTPGSIIPKAIGSKGLQPLDMPGRFDVSQLVLDSLQARIRHALLADRLAPIASPKMTATEVLERSAEMSLLLCATYGRLQSELLTPLIKRAFMILKRRGEIPDIALDGRLVAVDYRSPLARSQGQKNVQNTLSWISSVLAMGPEASAAINLPQAARFLGDALGVPNDLIRKDIQQIDLSQFIQPAPVVEPPPVDDTPQQQGDQA
ncbi:MAG TPA: portal protein [Alphaproteobacteria bacterium]|nr:head-tail connector protein [Alphaproteobacteria bacterium]USO04773.1 MAG: head-tail connector protein [Rhodospirillales bacterium]HOO81085.1 portal protein [Alphaproteobacteria bacterium]